METTRRLPEWQGKTTFYDRNGKRIQIDKWIDYILRQEWKAKIDRWIDKTTFYDRNGKRKWIDRSIDRLHSMTGMENEFRQRDRQTAFYDRNGKQIYIERWIDRLYSTTRMESEYRQTDYTLSQEWKANIDGQIDYILRQEWKANIGSRWIDYSLQQEQTDIQWNLTIKTTYGTS